MKKKYGFVLGRFQFLHYGHVQLLKAASNACETLIVLVGSSDKDGTYKHPLPYEHRKDCILEVALEYSLDLKVLPVSDNLYDNDQWVQDLAYMLNEKLDLGLSVYGATKDKPFLYCFHRDNDLRERTVMNRLFNICSLGPTKLGISATDIREDYFSGVDWEWGTPPSVASIISNQGGGVAALQEAKQDYQYRVEYNASWKAASDAAPFPLPQFQCTDVVVHNEDGEVLMIRRGHAPGIGRLAFPGGFLDRTDRSYRHGAARELQEETGLVAPLEWMQMVISLNGTQRGGDRGTNVYSIKLEECTGELKSQEGEVLEMVWVDPGHLPKDKFFADHLDLLKAFLSDGNDYGK